MGDAKHIDTVNIQAVGYRDEHAIGDYQHQMAVGIANGDFPSHWRNGKGSRLHSSRVQWKRRSRLRLEFDFKERRCSVFLNDRLLGKLTEDFPQHFFPAVSLRYRNTSVKTTCFEV